MPSDVDAAKYNPSSVKSVFNTLDVYTNCEIIVLFELTMYNMLVLPP